MEDRHVDFIAHFHRWALRACLPPAYSGTATRALHALKIEPEACQVATANRFCTSTLLHSLGNPSASKPHRRTHV